jgi:hypothetical protein
MTLILNEFYLSEGLNKTTLIAAADRRLTNPDGSYHATRRKLFEISYLNGAISYFGLAVVFPRERQEYLSSWLPNFIRHQSTTNSLQTFAQNLRDELNQIVPSRILRTQPSGFHICGYDNKGLPDFWYVSNIGGMRGFQYVNLMPQYARPRSHFLSRDAKKLGWDGKNPLSARSNIAWVYRNGDVRAHVVAWELLDEIFDRLFKFPDFNRPRTRNAYVEYIKFKFEFIAQVYKKWAKKKIIARPIDVLIFYSP